MCTNCGLPAAPYLSSYLDLHLDLLSVSLLGSTPPSLFTPLRALIPLRGRPTPLSIALQGSSLRCSFLSFPLKRALSAK